MNSILKHLFRCAMEDQKQYLNQQESRNYHDANRAKEKRKEQLEELLEGEALRLFEQFVESFEDESNLTEISYFRTGLAMGLKLGAFCISEY